MNTSRKLSNLNILTSISPKFVAAWDDIVNHDFITFVNSVDFEKLPVHQQLCCLHLASLGRRLNQVKEPKRVTDSEDMSYLDQHKVLSLDLIQQQDYKLAKEFFEANFKTDEPTLELVLPGKLNQDEKIAILFWACLCGWPVEHQHIYRMYEKKDHSPKKPFAFNKDTALHAGFTMEETALSIMKDQTIEWNKKSEFNKFTKTFKKAIPYGVITRKSGTSCKDWHYNLLRKDGVIIHSDKIKFLNRFKKEDGYIV